MIKGLDLKKYLSHSKSFSQGVLEPKLGRAVYTFPPRNIVTSIDLKRISGNGKVMIKCGNVDTNLTVSSKISESFSIVSGNCTIEVLRPSDSIGKVSVLGITIELANVEDSVVQNWKKLIAKCGHYTCLRQIGDRLFASEGAVIEKGDNVQNIETDPPMMWSRQNGKIKFLGACEICLLDINDTAQTPPNIPLYANRNAPTPLLVLEPQEPVMSIINPPLTAETIENSGSKPFYDSSIHRSLAQGKVTSIKRAKHLVSNGQDYLVLQSAGSCAIQIPNLQANTEYIVGISAKRFTGNGRVHFGFSSDASPARFTEAVLTKTHVSDHFITLKTGPAPFPGKNHRLYISTPDDCTGDILIAQIKLYTTAFSNGEEENTSFVKHTAPSSYKRFVPLNSRRFVIVIPSYKNSLWCERNIQSVIDQNYEHYRAIFVDDNSPDDTFTKVSNIVNYSNKKSKFTLIKNTTRKGALCNLYNMIHSCDDDEIIITLDGDDWLSNSEVLNRLNEVYSNNDVWLTYGQYKNHPDGGTGVAKQIPEKIISSGTFRKHEWCSSHLRTFYAWLFKNIDKNDLMYRGDFFTMTWDMVMMFPMLEMAGHRSKYLSDILYIYNLENPINDHKVDVTLQRNLDRHVRNMPCYSRIAKSPLSKTKKSTSVGLLIIATGKYNYFVQGLISSANNYFLNESGIDVTYYVFTDKDLQIESKRQVVQIHIDHKPFPHASMDRFMHFTNHAETLASKDYLFYIDVDCQFVDVVSNDILGDLVGVQHCGYVTEKGPYEQNPNSCFYVPSNYDKEYKVYFGGGLSGGLTPNYLRLSKWCKEMIEKDLANNVMPVWHDETALNRYFLDHEPTVILSPSYHYPQSNLEHYTKKWPHKYHPKIILLEKKHSEIRQA